MRPIHTQHDDFPSTVDGRAALPAVVTADIISRPTQVLTDEQVAAVREVYRVLATAAFREDQSLQVSSGLWGLATDLLPSQDTTNPPSRHADPPDVPPHR